MEITNLIGSFLLNCDRTESVKLNDVDLENTIVHSSVNQLEDTLKDFWKCFIVQNDWSPTTIRRHSVHNNSKLKLRCQLALSQPCKATQCVQVIRGQISKSKPSWKHWKKKKTFAKFLHTTRCMSFFWNSIETLAQYSLWKTLKGNDIAVFDHTST